MSNNAINRFFTLNKMQKSVSKSHKDTWELRAVFGKRSRSVSFIRKDQHGYTVTMTGITYQTFMAALASLLDFYINEIWKLCRSESPLSNTASDVTESVKMYLSNAASWDLSLHDFKERGIDMSVPRLPTYDRGKKKEVLRPLRKAVTRWFGGKH